MTRSPNHPHATLARLALATALTLAGSSTLAAAAYNFAGVVDSGPLLGESFLGSFAFDDTGLTPGLDGDLLLTQFSLNLGDYSYTLASADAPASASFIGGVFSGLAYVDIDTPDATSALQVALVPGFFGLDEAYLAYETAAGLGGYGSYAVTVVPEPASLAMLLAGLLGLAARNFAGRRQRRA